MTNDNIILMAVEAGARDCANPDKWDIWEIRDTDLERFAELVAAHEREECAKLCEDEIERIRPLYSVTAENCTKVIRARGNQ
jgi:hypothetical protein